MKAPIKKERIFRVLSLKEELNISQLSKETGLAKSYVFKVLRELEDENVVWISRKIYVNHDLLIRKWGEVKRSIFEKISPLTINLLIPDKIRNILKDYVISGPFAEMLIQGESSGKPLIIYVDEKNFLSIKEIALSRYRTGTGYIRLYPYDNDIFRNSWIYRGWRMASYPQIAADIIALGTFADIGLELYKRWLDARQRI